jgi:predicted permease
MLFALGATLTTALFFGVAPALQTAVGEPGPLKGGRALAGTARGRRMRQAIVVAEIALALIVVVGAGLLVRSFLALTARDPGFHASNLLSFNVQMVTKPTDAARAETARLLIERLADLPGVSEVGASTGLPAVTPQRGTRFQIEGRTLSPDEDGALFIAATPGYFAALGTPVLRGRAIERIDVAGGQPVVVVNRRLAQQLFGDRDPVGRRIRILQPQYETEWRTIVGVVGDVQYQEPSAEIPPTVYTAFSQTPFLWLYVMVRPDGSADALRRSIGTAVSGVDPSLTAANVRLMTSLVGESVAEPRFSMLLVSAFAGLALALAAVGVYGVIAYSVARRTQEFGIRMALGARASNVIGMVLREALLIAAAGVVVGLTGAALLTRLMGTLLFGISPQDPVTFGTGAVLLVGVALLASYIPSRRALRADPIAALRTE